MVKVPIPVINHQSNIQTNNLCQKKQEAGSWGQPWGYTEEAKNATLLRSGTVMCLGFREGVKMARVMISGSGYML